YLRYGEKTIKITIDDRNLLAILQPKLVEPVKDENIEIRKSITDPIGTNGLCDLLQKAKSVVILSDDNTRSTPVRDIMPIILNELNKAGVKDKNIKIVVALGTHQPMSSSEIAKRFSIDIARKIEIINHEPFNKDKLTYLGYTYLGTPIWINSVVMQADFIIGIGNIVPHRISGWSGGAKIIQPGVSGSLTTGMTHLLAARYHCEQIIGNVNNPVRKEMEDIARKVGLNFIVNTVLNRNGEIVKVVGGDFIFAHREGVELARTIYGVRISEPADIAIIDSYPADLDFWQAIKALFVGQLLVKKGGAIIFASPCYEGVCPTHGALLELASLTLDQLKAKIEEGQIKDLAAAADTIMRKEILQKAQVKMYSDCIPEDHIRQLGFIPISSVQKALEESVHEYGSDATVIVATHTAELLPLIG
ncbi:nickel-dependent lactate racemase, partial [Candidatus Aerophobetes bacterium]|nr:nickel-dependent lactate racemase [Candidatus Aerophobetes bacterium]